MSEASLPRAQVLEQFVGVGELDEVTESEGHDEDDNAASIVNPNKNDDRRLFQIYDPEFEWDPHVRYEEQLNRLSENGPKPLVYPDHF